MMAPVDRFQDDAALVRQALSFEGGHLFVQRGSYIVRVIALDWFARIAAYERRFGCTIQRGRSIVEQADHGRPFAAALRQPALAQRALLPGWDEPVRVAPGGWELPAGAHGNSAGPT